VATFAIKVALGSLGSVLRTPELAPELELELELPPHAASASEAATATRKATLPRGPNCPIHFKRFIESPSLLMATW
jgi:hypothetical protein